MTSVVSPALLVHVPFRIRKQGGRKEIILPEGATVPRIRTYNTVVKALALAFR